MSMDNTLLVEVVIAHGDLVEAHLLHEDTPILFGAFVWHIVDVKFVDGAMSEVQITMARYDKEGKATTQKMIVGKEFEIRTLWVTQRKAHEVFNVEGTVDAKSND